MKAFRTIPAILLTLSIASQAMALDITAETSSGKDWSKAVFKVNGIEYTVTSETGSKYVTFAENGAVGTILLEPDGQYTVNYAVTPAPAGTATPIPIPQNPTPTPLPITTIAPMTQAAPTYFVELDEEAEGSHARLLSSDGVEADVPAITFGIVYTTFHLTSGDLRVRTSDLTFSTLIPANVKTALIRSKAVVRDESGKDAAKVGAIAAGTVCVVLEVKGEYIRVKTNEVIGWIRKDNAAFYGEWNAANEGCILYKGKTTGTGNVFIRSDDSRDSARITKWHVGTHVTIMSETRDWYEVEANGMHGWVMKDNVKLD